jgi:hypothetical protein
MSIVIYAQGIAPILPLRPSKDPVARAFGWDTMTQRAESAAVAATAQTGHHSWLGADRYQEASELAFHGVSAGRTFAMNLGGRRNQYDLWPRFRDAARPGENLILVLDETPDIPPVVERLASLFAAVDRGELISLRRGPDEITTRRIWVLAGWNGLWR